MAVPETKTPGPRAATETDPTDDTSLRDVTLGAARSWARQFTAADLLRSTPARLLAVGIALLLGTLAAGLITATVAAERKQDIDTLLSTTQPLARSAQNLYSSLSIADASAATAFLSSGAGPNEARDTYSQAIGSAAAELVAISDGLPGDDRGRQLLTSIATRLPVYAGLIETARTNNRTANPVGGSYQAEASSFMQTDILPIAQELQTERADAARDAQAEFGRPPWVTIALLVALLIGLVATQVVMARRTRRTFNLGLLVTTAAMSALLIWMLVAGLVSATSVHRAIRHGTDPVATFATSRILAQQARTQEILQLVRRESKAEHAAAFARDTEALGTLLDDYPYEVGADDAARAGDALDGWMASHTRMTVALDNGDWTGAAMTTVGSDADSSARQFGDVDEALGDGADAARAQARNAVARASTVLSALGPGAAVITLVAAVGIPFGLWPRLREYQ